MIYEVPEWKIDDLETRIAVLARKAEKIGVDVPSITRLVEFDRKVRNPDGPSKPFFVRVVQVDVAGSAPRFKGWGLVAILQHDTGTDDNIIRTVTPDIELPTEYRAQPAWCDHCQVYRRRNDTYLVHHDTEGIKQVGSSCLRDFLGHNNPQDLASIAQSLADLYEDLGDIGGPDEDGWFDLGPGEYAGTYRLALVDFLATVSQMIRLRGWTSRGDAYESNRPATADLAWNAMMRSVDGVEPPGPEDKRVAQAAVDWLATAWEGEDLNDYQHNLKTVGKAEAVGDREIGLAASIIPAYHREMERQAALARRLNEYFGTVKKRYTFDHLKLVWQTNWDNQWGVQWLHKFEDAEGRIFIWVTNSYMESGLVYQGKGTVTDHTEYNGEKQTKISRCVLDEVQPDMGEPHA